MISVVHLGKYYSPHSGGMETHLQQLCEGVKDQLQVRAIVANDTRTRIEEMVNGVPVTRLKNYGVIASTPMSLAFLREIRRANDNILHLHHPNPIPTLALLGGLGPSQRLVVTWHSDIVNQRFFGPAFSPVLHHMLRRADAVIATSTNYLESSPYLKSYRYKCHVIPLAIDVDLLLGSCCEQVVRTLRAMAKRPIVLTVGRLVPYKGFEYLIDAMRMVDAELWIVGKGPLEDELRQRSSSLDGRVKLLGSVPDLSDYYAACDVFALPSINRSEAFGIVQLEAMAMGKPVVNTNLDSGVPFVSRDGETGITVPPRDSSALAEALTRLLRRPALREQMGRRSVERTKTEFSLPVMIHRILQLYDQLR